MMWESTLLSHIYAIKERICSMIHVRNGICRILVLLCAILVILLFSVVCYARENPDAYINWGEAILIHDFPQFTDAGKDYRGELPGKFGSQFPRMLICDNGDWLVAYTIYDRRQCPLWVAVCGR